VSSPFLVGPRPGQDGGAATVASRGEWDIPPRLCFLAEDRFLLSPRELSSADEIGDDAEAEDGNCSFRVFVHTHYLLIGFSKRSTRAWRQSRRKNAVGLVSQP
jgi:hypothetical protein